MRIGEREPVHQDQVIRTEEVEQPTEGLFASVKTEGTRLTLEVVRACDLTQVKTVSRTTTVESFNESPNTSWMIAGTGVVGIGLGASMMAGAIETDPTHPTKDRNTGIALTAGGVAMITAAAIDAIRASASTSTSEEITLPGARVKHGVRCSDAPGGRLAVVGRLLDDEVVSLGSTDPKGVLVVDLDAAIPGVYLKHNEPMVISVGEEVVGSVDLSTVVQHRASREFANLDLQVCRNATKVISCDHVNAFIGRYPESKEAKEALLALKVGEPLIAAMVDDEAWDQVKASDCARTEHDSAEAQYQACADARHYRDHFPNGKHASEVTEILEKAKARADRLQATVERTEKAEAAKEAAAERAKCVGQCKVICSSWRFKDQGSCMEGCLQSQCSAFLRTAGRGLPQ